MRQARSVLIGQTTVAPAVWAPEQIRTDGAGQVQAFVPPSTVRLAPVM